MNRTAFVSGLLVAAAGLMLAAPDAQAACSVTQGSVDSSGTNGLKIVGDQGIQILTINDSGDSVQVQLDCNHDGDLLDATDVNQTYLGVETVIIDLRGIDQITYNVTGTWTGVSRNLTLVLGPSGNTVNFAGNGIVQGQSSLFVNLLGGANLDVVNCDFSAASFIDSALFVWGDLGPGQDRFSFSAPTATTSEIDVDADLMQGNNHGSFASTMPLVASTVRGHITGSDSDTEKDIIGSRFGGVIDAASRVSFTSNMRDGFDQYDGVVDVSTTQLLNGSEARILVSGDFGNDFLTVSDGGGTGAAIVNGLLDIDLRGGPASDNMAVDLNGITGTGTVRVRENGGLGIDTVAVSVATDAASTNNLDLVAQGGKREDVVYGFIFDMGGNATFNPSGAAWLDGGVDTDTSCLAFGNVAMDVFNCEPIR